jgi:antitoxin (DNA-binding transcriptional repressor) of toxin-antitoxin stability system
MKASIVDLHYHMKDVLRAIDRGETVTVLYRGKEKARLVPLNGTKPEQPVVRTQDTPFFGMWADREDMADPAAYVRKLREPRFAHLLEGGLFPAKAKPKRKAKTRRRARAVPTRARAKT